MSILSLYFPEHDKVLQLICFNNPVPDDRRPLPETCDGVERELTSAMNNLQRLSKRC